MGWSQSRQQVYSPNHLNTPPPRHPATLPTLPPRPRYGYDELISFFSRPQFVLFLVGYSGWLFALFVLTCAHERYTGVIMKRFAWGAMGGSLTVRHLHLHTCTRANTRGHRHAFPFPFPYPHPPCPHPP